MQAYRRFVSYVYQYENGKKAGNRGFIKVEARGNTCSMQISLKGVCKDGNTSCSVYGFKREDGLLKGSLLAECPVKSGVVREQLTFARNEMGRAKYGLQELSGVIFQGGDQTMYGTQWDDDPMKMENFQPDEKNDISQKENSEPEAKDEENIRGWEDPGVGEWVVADEREPDSNGAEMEENGEETQEEAAEQFPEKQVEEVQREETVSEEEGITVEVQPEEVEVEEEEITGEIQPEEVEEEKVTGEIQPEEVEEEKVTGEIQPEEVEEEEVTGEIQLEEVEEEEVTGEIQPEEVEEEEVTGEIQPEEVEEEDAARESQPEEEEVLSEGAAEMETEPVRDIKLTEILDTTVPLPNSSRQEPESKNFCPFSDGILEDCQKIKIGDLKFMDPRDQSLRNNRFVQHGYQMFGHLLLARIARNGQYILGVPGIYQQQEKFMADMFGFHNFKYAKRVGPRSSNFGYWYRLIYPPKLSRGNGRAK